jgi:putative transposase
MLIGEAVQSGSRLAPACNEAELSVRTYRRWTVAGIVQQDRRPDAQRPEPLNKLTTGEVDDIVTVCNEKRFASLPPSQIVPKLADSGRYISSESSFYRVLKAK